MSSTVTQQAASPPLPDDSETDVRNLGGRPSKATPETLAALTSRIAAGETLAAICKDQDMPSPGTVWRWRQENSGFRDSYALARVAQMEVWADEIVEIADDSTLDMVEKVGRNGSKYMAVDQENIARSRLRVDTRKFLMAKLAPHLFGERIEVAGTVAHEHSGTIEITDRERMRRLATFMLDDSRAIEGQATLVSGPAAQPAQPAASSDEDDG